MLENAKLSLTPSNRAEKILAAGIAIFSLLVLASIAHGQEGSAPTSPKPERKAKVMATAAAPVNVNTASLEALQTLPKVGPKLAEKIIQGRPYANLEALDAVKGIGPKLLEALRPLVVFQ